MIQSRTETNRLMDWTRKQDVINYFMNLRKFLKDIDAALIAGQTIPCECGSMIRNIFKKWNLYFIEVDEIPRVNLDEPKEL